MQQTDSGADMNNMIQQAMNDQELTTAEYDQIMTMAAADNMMNDQDRQMLNQFQGMIAEGRVKRIAG